MVHEIDSFRINFSVDQMRLLNYCLAFMMFGIALDMRVSHFRDILRFPKSVIVGLASQWLILPILTVYLIHIWNPLPAVALGLLLVAACPGGNVSNYATYMSKGNAALPVTLSAFVMVSSIVLTPFVFAGFAKFVPQVRPLLATIELPALKILWMLVQIVFIPMVMGMLTRHYLPKITSLIRKPINLLSMSLFLIFIIVAIYGEIDNIIKYVKYVLVLVIVHNLIALVAGYWWARWHKLPESDARAISMETGIQNSGLGMLMIITFFPTMYGMMLVTAFWAIWDLVSSFILALYWKKKGLPSVEITSS